MQRGGINEAGDYGLANVLATAVSGGFFPDPTGLQEYAYGKDSADVQVLIDAIAEELSGSPRYANPPVPDVLREAAGERDQLLSEVVRDAGEMTNGEIREFLERFDRGEQLFRGFLTGRSG